MTPPFVCLLVLCSLALTVTGWIAAVLATRPTRMTWGQVAAILAAVACSRWALAIVYGASTPYWDQWSGEAATLLIPYLDGQLDFTHLIAPHNEHRIWFTRMEVLGLLQLTGSWDPTQQMCVNALLQGMAASLVWLVCVRGQNAGSRTCLGILVVALMAGPVHWENSLAGFQSQFAYCLLFTAASFLILPRAVDSWRWWGLLVVMLVACLFTVGGGVLAAAAAGGALVVMTMANGTWREPRVAAGLLACIALTGIGLAVLPHVSYHDSLRAGDAAAFLTAFGKTLGWPSQKMLGWLVLGAPAVVSALLYIRLGTALIPAEVIALSIWIVLQSAALAASRGVGGVGPAGRHLDVVVVNLVVSGFFLFSLLIRFRPAIPLTLLAAGVWLIAWLPRFVDASVDGLLQSAERLRLGRQHGDVVSRYLESRDPSLMQLRPLDDIPCWSGDYLKRVLEHPKIPGILPLSIRWKCILTGEGGGFAHPGHYPFPKSERAHSLGSYALGSGDTNTGRWRSALLESPGDGIAFDVSGYLGQPGLTMDIVWQDGEKTPVRSRKTPRESWRRITVLNRNLPYRIELTDDSAAQWLAVCPPVAVSLWDRVAYWCGRHVESFAITGLMATIAFAFLSLREPAASSTS